MGELTRMPIVSDKSELRILVGDIGGTNARLAIATLGVSGVPELADFKAFPCANFNELDDVLATYFSELKGAAPRLACLAVAGPVINDQVHLTNLGWTLDAREMESRFGFDRLHLTNDFAALARSTTALGTKDLMTVRDGVPSDSGPVSVMGPGTGFGLSLLVKHPAGYSIISGEGGHISFMPHGDLETKVWFALQESIGRVTVETLLSGIGLMRIYRELCHIHGATPLNYDPRTISYQALEHDDAICQKALSVFCSMLGSVAGDIVLSHGSTGGVYLGGGILPKIKDYFMQSDFTARFLDKPPMQAFVEKVPVHLIIAPDAALKGAALIFAEHAEHSNAA